MIEIVASHSGPISAFLSEVDSGSRLENAAKQKIERDRASLRCDCSRCGVGRGCKKTGPSRMGPDKSEHGFKWNVDLSF
jgi:hypothetical protein